MTKDKYQITEKANYINLLLLKDELEYYDNALSKVVNDSESWTAKLRAVRNVFLTLNNVKDAANSIQITGEKEFVAKTRKLRKELQFSNHFRNRGIGHLNSTMLERAVQWFPHIFHESTRGNEAFQIMEAQRAIIESGINSYIDAEGIQKVFGTEIDLMYPANANQFFEYLADIVHFSLIWLKEGASFLMESIKYHSDEEVQELAAIAGQTNFDLKKESNLSFSLDQFREGINNELDALLKEGVDPEILEHIRAKLK